MFERGSAQDSLALFSLCWDERCFHANHPRASRRANGALQMTHEHGLTHILIGSNGHCGNAGDDQLGRAPVAFLIKHQCFNVCPTNNWIMCFCIAISLLISYPNHLGQQVACRRVHIFYRQFFRWCNCNLLDRCCHLTRTLQMKTACFEHDTIMLTFIDNAVLVLKLCSLHFKSGALKHNEDHQFCWKWVWLHLTKDHCCFVSFVLIFWHWINPQKHTREASFVGEKSWRIEFFLCNLHCQKSESSSFVQVMPWCGFVMPLNETRFASFCKCQCLQHMQMGRLFFHALNFCSICTWRTVCSNDHRQSNEPGQKMQVKSNEWCTNCVLRDVKDWSAVKEPDADVAFRTQQMWWDLSQCQHSFNPNLIEQLLGKCEEKKECDWISCGTGPGENHDAHVRLSFLATNRSMKLWLFHLIKFFFLQMDQTFCNHFCSTSKDHHHVVWIIVDKWVFELFHNQAFSGPRTEVWHDFLLDQSHVEHKTVV